MYNAFTVSSENSKMVSFASSIMKKILACLYRCQVKLIYCITFESASSDCVPLILLVLSHSNFWNKDNLEEFPR